MSCPPPAWFQGMSQGGRGVLSPPPADWAHEVTTVCLLHGKNTFNRQTKPRRWDGEILGALDNPDYQGDQTEFMQADSEYIKKSTSILKYLHPKDCFVLGFSAGFLILPFLKNSGFPFRLSQHSQKFPISLTSICNCFVCHLSIG